MVAASHIASAAASPHRARAWARDCRTATVVMPTPPPSASRFGRVWMGAMFAASSSSRSSGGSSRPAGPLAARAREVSSRSSTRAVINGATDS